MARVEEQGRGDQATGDAGTRRHGDAAKDARPPLPLGEAWTGQRAGPRGEGAGVAVAPIAPRGEGAVDAPPTPPHPPFGRPLPGGEAVTGPAGARPLIAPGGKPAAALSAVRRTLRRQQLVTLPGLWAAAQVLWNVAFGPFLATAASLGFLLLCTLVLFRTSLVDGQFYYRSDTVTYYYPIANRLVDVLREGQLMLWTPYIFGGFPLFADGEAGMLYPPNLMAYFLLPEESAILWLRIIHYFLAASFTYAYLQTLRLNRPASVIGGLTFAFGSFMVMQMHHTNVMDTAIWLPLTLALVELSVRNVRRWRWVYGLGAGISVGVQALGLHIQPLLMSGIFLAAYLPFRVMLCPIAWPAAGKRSRRLTSILPGLAAPASRVTALAGRLMAEPRRLLAPGLGILRSQLTQGRAILAKGLWRANARFRRLPDATRVEGGQGDPWETPIDLERRLALSRPEPELPPGQDLPGEEGRNLTAVGLDLRPVPTGAEAPTPVNGTGNHVQPAGDRTLPYLPAGRAGSMVIHLGNRCRTAAQRGQSLVSSVPGWLLRHLAGTFHRAVLAALLLAMIPVTAFGLAAVQLIPLAELGLFSFRGTGVTYQFATSYSMPVQNLVNLVFPYFFRYTNRFYWSLWSEWETTLYVGIASLVMVSIAVIFVRNRMVIFFAVVAAVSVILAFGGYSPYPLLEQVRQLPGFSSLRVPGRFTMLATLSAAVLAAFGVDWLCRTLRPPRSRERIGWWRRLTRGVAFNAFGIYLVGLLAAMGGVAWWLFSLRAWAEKEPWAVKRFIEEGYLALRSSKPWLTSDMVLTFLGYSLDPANERTAVSLALMLATFVLLFSWFLFRRLWRVWSTLLVVLVAVDMLIFATDFHPTMPTSQLRTPNGAAQWLMANNEDGMQRSYSAREVRKTEANKLLPYRVSEITGYSSLQTTRHLEYMVKAIEVDKSLLDLYNTHYVVLPKRFPALASYEYTAYHPNRPLADGPRSNRGAHVTFYMNPAVKADEVSFISSLRDAVEIPQDAEVAEIVVVDTAGERVTLKVKAGKDTSEWAYDRPDVTGIMRHNRGRVADKMNVTDQNGISYQANLYFGELKLDKTRTVSRVEFHYTHPQGKIRLFGLMLWENPDKAHQVLSRNKFIPRYEDDEVLIAENPSRLPRAYLVPTARIIKPSDMLNTMAHGDFDPEKVVLLEPGERPPTMPNPVAGTGLPDAKELAKTAEKWLQGSAGVANPKKIEKWLQGNSDARPGSAEITSYRSTEVAIRTRSDRNAVLFLADAYYPGWKAYVDGRQEEIYRANSLFRGVLVPAGDHEVRFVFEPDSFVLGTQISVFTASAVMLLLALLILSVPVWRLARVSSMAAWRGGRWAWRRRRRPRE